MERGSTPSLMVFNTGWSADVDGPGQRLMVYAKGCNFRCRWCANPESISGAGEMLFYPARQLPDANACPLGAVELDGGIPHLCRKTCATCTGRPCVSIWKHRSFEWVGRELPVTELLDTVHRGRTIFGPEGGVTFGGGEVTLQAPALDAAISALLAEAIDVTVESNASTDGFRRLIGGPVRLFADLKAVDPALHLEWTGAPNDAVLENIARAAAGHERLVIRIPFVTGFNTELAEQRRIAEYLHALRRADLRVEILRLHHAGAPKYAALDQPYPMTDIAPPGRAEAQAFAALLQRADLAAAVAA